MSSLPKGALYEKQKELTPNLNTQIFYDGGKCEKARSYSHFFGVGDRIGKNREHSICDYHRSTPKCSGIR